MLRRSLAVTCWLTSRRGLASTSLDALSRCAALSIMGFASVAHAAASETDQPPPAAPEVRPPRLLTPLSATYPISGTGEHIVTLELVVGVAGELARVQVVEGADPFASAAVTASKNWGFVPAVRNGRRVAARIRVQVRFVPPALGATDDVDSSSPAAASAAPSTPPEVEVAPVEVTVLGDLPSARQTLGQADVRLLPGAFGDPFRAVEVMPGVTPIVSGLSYFFIRGAPPGNVGYFFDDVSIPLLYHGAAGPGVLHPSFVENVNLYPAAYPAKYGRYAGGIVEGELAAPAGRLRAQASLRLLDAGAFAEVPFADGRGNLMVGGRYSFTGLLLSALVPDINVGYWDYQAAASYALTPRGTLSVLAFGSHDYVADTEDPSRPVEVLNLTFHRARVKYLEAISPSTLFGVSLYGGLNRTSGGTEPEQNEPTADAVGKVLGTRLGVEHQFDEALSIHVGADSQWSRNEFEFGADTSLAPPGAPLGSDAPTPPQLPALDEPPVLTPEPDAPIVPTPFEGDPAARLPRAALYPDRSRTFDWDPTHDLESNELTREQYSSRDDVLSGLWLELGWRLTPIVYLKPSLRFDSFLTGNTWDYSIDPRLTARYRLTQALTMVHTLGTAHQGPSFVIPVPGLNPKLTGRLQRALQSSAGAELHFPEAVFASVTGFQNVTLDSSDVLSASRFSTTSDSTNPFVARTTAHSYGVEFSLRRSLSKSLGGFLAYTLSRSLRSTDRASGVSSFDRTHVLNVAASYQLGRNWRLGARLLTYSGLPAEVGSARAFANPPRTSWFYRIDWRLEKRWTLSDAGSWLAVVAEVVNTTLNREALSASCYAYGCTEQKFGPVTLPSLGVEGAL